MEYCTMLLLIFPSLALSEEEMPVADDDAISAAQGVARRADAPISGLAGGLTPGSPAPGKAAKSSPPPVYQWLERAEEGAMTEDETEAASSPLAQPASA